MRIVCLADSLISRKNECTYILFLLFSVYSPLYPCPEITVYRNKGWFSLAWNFFVEQSCQKTLLRNLAIIVPILARKQTIFDGESILCADKSVYHSLFIRNQKRKKKKKKISLHYNISLRIIHLLFDLLLFRYQCFNVTFDIFPRAMQRCIDASPWNISNERMEKIVDYECG